MAIVKATNHVECPPKERHLRSAWIPPPPPRATFCFCVVPGRGLICPLCCRDCGGDVYRQAKGGRRLLHPCAGAPPCQDPELDCKHIIGLVLVAPKYCLFQTRSYYRFPLVSCILVLHTDLSTWTRLKLHILFLIVVNKIVYG